MCFCETERMARRRFRKRDKEVVSLAKMMNFDLRRALIKSELSSATFVPNCHELMLLFLNGRFDILGNWCIYVLADLLED